MTQKASIADVRRANRALLLRHMLLEGPTSRRDLTAVTGLSPGTVTNVMNSLLDEGAVREDGFRDSSGGRPRAIVSLAGAAAVVIGADVGETHIRTGAYSLALGRLASREHVIDGRHIEVDEARTVIADHITSLMAELSVPRSRLLGVGVGVPGIVEQVNRADGTVHAIVHAEVIGWRDVSFDGLSDQLQTAVFLDNGAKTTTQAECWYGAARGVEHAVMVLIGDGAGAGIITDGHIYRGSSSSAGEWGHTKISLDGPQCRCGSRGCVETFVGVSAVLHQWQGDQDWAGREPEGVATLFAAWHSGDPIAQKVTHGLIQTLGLSLANLVNLYNPQKIIIGGWFGDRIATELLPELRQAVRTFSLSQPGGEAVLQRPALGQEAVALGAATLPINHFIEYGGSHQLATRALPKGTSR